jgi:hypothetical protein
MKQIKLMCPKCKADLTVEDAIDNIRTGAQKNFLTFNRIKGWFDVEEYEFESDGIYEEYTCAKCDADVSTVIKNYI